MYFYRYSLFFFRFSDNNRVNYANKYFSVVTIQGNFRTEKWYFVRKNKSSVGCTCKCDINTCGLYNSFSWLHKASFIILKPISIKILFKPFRKCKIIILHFFARYYNFSANKPIEEIHYVFIKPFELLTEEIQTYTIKRPACQQLKSLFQG